METMKLRVFQRQVEDQCRLALHGAQLLRQSAQRVWDGTYDPASTVLWTGAHILITGSSNVSKALWGQSGTRARAREPLRRSLGVRDDSPLRATSKIRNDLEHYDERIDNWWKNSDGHRFLDRHIGSPDTVGGTTQLERFRVYDIEADRITFWGSEFLVGPIVTALEALLPIAEAEGSKLH